MTSADSRAEFVSPADPRAIRALAHPVRMALIELLAHTGTLTATQASEVLDESPANCAFHLRTLAKYGFVEEAGGGQGRERPWRRARTGLNFSEADDSAYSAAVQALQDVFLAGRLERLRAALSRRASWPAGWQSRLGMTQALSYLTPAEEDELSEELVALLTRYASRVDHPEQRPAGAIPVEIVALGYPLLHLLDAPDPAVQHASAQHQPED
jgi:predicted ArsR family transcriptional regulator